jgi:hypothetical protein
MLSSGKKAGITVGESVTTLSIDYPGSKPELYLDEEIILDLTQTKSLSDVIIKKEGELNEMAEQEKQAIKQDQNNPELYGALAGLYAWQGEFEAALDALRWRIALDGRDPLQQYASFEPWRRRIQDKPTPDSWDGLLRIYSPWRNRFQDRAETYVLAALVLAEQRNDLTCTKVQLQLGLDRKAEPRGLLLHYLHHFQESE